MGVVPQSVTTLQYKCEDYSIITNLGQSGGGWVVIVTSIPPYLQVRYDTRNVSGDVKVTVSVKPARLDAQYPLIGLCGDS